MEGRARGVGEGALRGVERDLPVRRDRVQIATKCGMRWDTEEGTEPWETKDREGRDVVIRKNSKYESILYECEQSLRRLKTDVIDLYQIHWPERNVPMFGGMYYDPTKERTQTSIHEQLEAMDKLVKQGKVRCIGLSNETPYGVHEFVRLAEQHGLPRVATVQNVFNLTSRALENGQSIVELTAEAALPTAYGARRFVDAGGLIAVYGDTSEIIRRTAMIVRRILADETPAAVSSPPLQPHVALNTATARRLGLEARL